MNNYWKNALNLDMIVIFNDHVNHLSLRGTFQVQNPGLKANYKGQVKSGQIDQALGIIWSNCFFIVSLTLKQHQYQHFKTNLTRFYLVFGQFDQILPTPYNWLLDLSPELEKWLQENCDLEHLLYSHDK